jgi:hypothetical protein
MPNTDMNSTVPCYVIYCDESCHELTPRHAFMAIGGLKVPRVEKANLSRKLRVLMRSCKLHSECKWSKVSNKKLEAYKKIVDFFFEHTEMHFRAIVVEQAKVQLEQYHGRDRELAFYKFYYEMLEKWLQPGNEYLILLDYKSNRGADRYMALKTCLQNYLGQTARIRDLTIIDSSQAPLAQLCDILAGAVAAENNGFEKHTAKGQLANYIRSSAGLSTLCASTPPPPIAEKFNIFKMDLR